MLVIYHSSVRKNLITPAKTVGPCLRWVGVTLGPCLSINNAPCRIQQRRWTRYGAHDRTQKEMTVKYVTDTTSHIHVLHVTDGRLISGESPQVTISHS